MKLPALVIAIFLSIPILAADDPLAGVGELIFKGHAEEARTQIHAAQKSYRAEGNKGGEAISLLMLGMADASLSNATDARADLTNSAELFIELNDHFGAWLALWAHAQFDKREGRFTDALATHERALTLLTYAQAPGVPMSTASLAALAPIFGASEDMLGLVAANPEIVKTVLFQFAEIMSRDAYGEALIEAGELNKAEEQLTKAAAQGGMFGELFSGSISAHMGDLHRRRWELDEARKSYMAALQGVKALPIVPFRDAWVEVEILGSLAEVETLQGRTDEALAWNDRALKLVRTASNPKREASILEDRGHLLLRGSRFEAAEAVFTEALKLSESNKDVARRASLYGNLGALYMLTGQYGKSAAALEKSIELYQTVDDPYSETPVWTLLAEVYVLLDSDKSAAEAVARARTLAKNSGFKVAELLIDVIAAFRAMKNDHGAMVDLEAVVKKWEDHPEAQGLMLNEDVKRLFRSLLCTCIDSASAPNPDAMTGMPVLPAMAYMLQGKALFQRGDQVGARTVWQKALEKNPSADLRAGYLALIGMTYWKEGKTADGVSYFERAAQALSASADDVKVEEMFASYLGSSRHYYYDLLIESLVGEKRYEEAFAQTERARARSFLRLIGNHRLRAAHGADDGLVNRAEELRTALAAQEQEGLRGRTDPQRLAQVLDEQRKRYEALMIRVKVSNPEYASITNVEPLHADEIRKELPDDTTLISYYVSNVGVHAWVMDRKDIHYARLPVDSSGLQRVVCWADSFSPRRDSPKSTRGGTVKGTAPCSGGRATAEEAFAKLFAPLRDKVRGSRLIVIPYGALHYVPFAALRDAENGQYLVEKYTLMYAPSASSLRFLRAKETPADGGALVIGNPATPLPVDRLPGAEQEANAIARLLGTTAVNGADASENLVDGRGGKLDVLHFAAHGIYEPEAPLFSRIALAAGNGQDGNLEVHEILGRVDLEGVNLVVLSACRTADGSRGSGDEIVGLTRAFLYAGSPGVVSTLWEISDVASAELMEEFYRQLVAGQPAADALREAQRSLLRDGVHQDPRYWAAFTLTGDPQLRWKSAAAGAAALHD